MSGSYAAETPTREILRLLFSLASHGAQSVVGLAEKTYRRHHAELPDTPETDFRRVAYYAKARGYLVEHHGRIILSQAGAARLEKLQLRAILIPKKWDRRWRLISFDIPENKRQARDAVRRLIKQLGFYKLQASLWVYPHDCSTQVKAIQSAYGVGEDIRLIVASEIQGESELEDHFRRLKVLR